MNKTEPTRLHIYEECLLLAIGDRTGNVTIGTDQASLLLASAIMGELLVDEVAKFDGGDHPVSLEQTKQYHDPILDDAVAKLSTAKGNYSLRNWIGRISSLNKLLEKCAHQLCERGILTSKEESVSWFFNRRFYPEINPEPENEIRKRIRGAILGETQVDPRTATVIGLASQMNLLNSFTTHGERKQYADRIETISGGVSAVTASRNIASQQQAAMLLATTSVLFLIQ